MTHEFESRVEESCYYCVHFNAGHRFDFGPTGDDSKFRRICVIGGTVCHVARHPDTPFTCRRKRVRFDAFSRHQPVTSRVLLASVTARSKDFGHVVLAIPRICHDTTVTPFLGIIFKVDRSRCVRERSFETVVNEGRGEINEQLQLPSLVTSPKRVHFTRLAHSVASSTVSIGGYRRCSSWTRTDHPYVRFRFQNARYPINHRLRDTPRNVRTIRADLVKMEKHVPDTKTKTRSDDYGPDRRMLVRFSAWPRGLPDIVDPTEEVRGVAVAGIQVKYIHDC